jgi:hypothetical protein
MMVCQICQEANEERSLFCRHCLAGIPSPGLGEDYRNENINLIRQACRNYARSLLSREDFIAALEGMKLVVIASIASLNELPMTEKLERDVGQQMSLIAEGLHFFRNGLDALLSAAPERSIQALARGLKVAEKGNHLLNEGLKIISCEEGRARLFSSSFHSAWLDAVKENGRTEIQ